MNLQIVEGTLMHLPVMVDDIAPVIAPRAWYAFQIEPGREQRVIDWLHYRQNYAEVYWPRYKANVKLNRHRRDIRWRGVIPGYLFVSSRYAHCPLSFRLILDHSAIHGVLCSGDQYARISSEDIGKIKMIEEALNASVICARDGIPFKVGQQVRVPRLGMDAKIVRIDNPRRLLLEGKLFGQVVNIVVPVLDIEAA